MAQGYGLRFSAPAAGGLARTLPHRRVGDLARPDSESDWASDRGALIQVSHESDPGRTRKVIPG